jgi:tRNA pseudouridine55 synthase
MNSGILNIDKPRGPTSHDIVKLVRRLTGIRRVGHAGTLDPLASGVLVVCVGRPATRIVEYLMPARKTYRAELRLGIVTDTYDAEGKVLAHNPVDVSREQVVAALERFVGPIWQTPPMYSAIKYKGKPLHRLARQGIEVEREPRRVEIFRLELISWRRDSCTLELDCSSGTYVRSLAHDLGQALGCGAYVTALTRRASGSFHQEDAITPAELDQAASAGRWSDLLYPIDQALALRFPALHLSVEGARRLCSGQVVEVLDDVQTADMVRAYGPDGAFLALAYYDEDANVWRPRKVFCASGYEPHMKGELEH